MDCEPTLSGAVASQSLMSDLFFALPVAFDHELAIVRPTDAPVMLDGMAIGKEAFNDAGSGFEVARWPIAPCFAAPGDGVPASCQHHLHGRFGLTLRGMDGIAGYALTAQTWRSCFDTGCIP
jgi:hypothetical protein